MTARLRPTASLATAVVLTGVAAGAVGAFLIFFLHLVQHLAYGYTDESFAIGSARASGARRVLAMAVGGAVVGLGWWALRRRVPTAPSVTAALRDSNHRLRLPSATADALLQIVAVGAGASLGREGAPRQVAAAVAEWLSARLDLPSERRHVLLACGAGAGLAAVYNVPLGGALFALEVLLRRVTLPDALIAVTTSGIATAVAWPVVGLRPTYRVASTGAPWTLVIGAVVLGPLAGLVGWAFRRLTTAARTHAPTGWRLPVTTTAVFAAVGALAIALPLVLGNGRGPASYAFGIGLPVGQLAALVVLKPLVTAACLRGGAIGGLLTPSVATGALLGALFGTGWLLMWPGSSAAAFAIVGAAAVLSVTQQAPLTAAVLAIEFTHADLPLLVPIVLAIAGAVGLSHAAFGSAVPELPYAPPAATEQRPGCAAETSGSAEAAPPEGVDGQAR